MASLTGTKIKNTYDGLLKTTDNEPLDGTLRTITDGLGNNSSLSLSTDAASIGGDLDVTGNFEVNGSVISYSNANGKIVTNLSGGTENAMSSYVSNTDSDYEKLRISSEQFIVNTGSGTSSSQRFVINENGDASFTNDLTVTGATSLYSNLSVVGDYVSSSGDITLANGDFIIGGTIYAASNITHLGDTDTYINFDTNQITVYTGVSARFNISDSQTSVYNTLYAQSTLSVAGNYTSIDGDISLANGDISLGGDIYVDGNVINKSDLDTSIAFGTNQISLITGGLTRLSVSDASVQVTNPLVASSTLAVTGDASFNTDTLFVDVSADRVGVNIAAPTEALDVVGNIKASGTLAVSGAATLSSTISAVSLTTSGNNTFNNSSGRAVDALSSGVLFASNAAAHDVIFGDGSVRYFSLHTPSGANSMSIRNFSTSTDIITCLQSGNVGIGVSPSYKLDVQGNGAAIRVSESGGAEIRTAAGGSLGYFGTYSNHPLTFLTNSSERMRILASGGITFNGDTSSANALDDYEEGTFTPTFVPTSGGFSSITYNVQYGKYTKIGNRVDINLQITCDSVSLGTAGGVLTIGGLPFTVGAKVCPVSLVFIANWPTDRFPIRATTNDGASNILLRYVTALNQNETYLSGYDIQAGSQITIMGTYFI
jgi:hypothetical protein